MPLYFQKSHRSHSGSRAFHHVYLLAGTLDASNSRKTSPAPQILKLLLHCFLPSQLHDSPIPTLLLTLVLVPVLVLVLLHNKAVPQSHWLPCGLGYISVPGGWNGRWKWGEGRGVALSGSVQVADQLQPSGLLLSSCAQVHRTLEEGAWRAGRQLGPLGSPAQHLFILLPLY